MKSEKRELRPFNGQRQFETLIGYVTTTETKTHTIHYETASWYTLVEVPPGKYEVVEHKNNGITWILVKYHGKITKEHFVNRLFTSSSVHEPTENIGKERGCSAQMYDYIAGREFKENPLWELAEDWELIERKTENFTFYYPRKKVEYNDKITDFGDVMAVEQFKDIVKCGGFVDYDGFAHPIRDGKMNHSIYIYPSEMDTTLPEDATHVCWYNK